jgi:diguanylate cyclase (GGDEF)-like protein
MVQSPRARAIPDAAPAFAWSPVALAQAGPFDGLTDFVTQLSGSWLWAATLHLVMIVLIVALVMHVHHRLLRRQNIELTYLVRETTAELIATNARLEAANAELQRISDVDGLTGIANRRRFDAYLASEWRHAVRTAAPLGIVFLDLDHFKALNDARGHLEGDAALRAVARALQEEVRRSADLVARYGGEEFAVLLTTTDLAGATEMAERLIHAVEALHYPHPDSPIGPHLTISAGVASAVATPDSAPDALLDAADRALYEAKNAGRNRVVATAAAHSRIDAAAERSEEG